MEDFILSGKKFWELVDAICGDRQIFQIKIKGYGSSMSPFIKSGHALIIQPVNREIRIKAGDIVALASQNREKIIVHRVIGIKNSLFQVKGDNCPRDDGWFQKTDILGIVRGVKTASGKTILYKRWHNVMIAFLSRTGLLNRIVLPLGRYIKNLFSHKGTKAQS